MQNLLVILSDQLRRRALGCYGDPHEATPHTDALAARGAAFDAAMSSCPICVPFRFTLMTGHSAQSRMVPGIAWRMSPAERTLADEFNDAGYDTLYVGKWHLYGGLGGWAMKKPIPRENQGRWQNWFGFEFRNDFFDNVCFHNEDPTPIPLPGYQTDALFDLTMDQLRRRQARGDTRPFAAVVSVEPPHPPLEAPKAHEDRWHATEMKVPASFMKIAPYDEPIAQRWSNWAGRMSHAEAIRARQTYYAMVSNLDDNVGRMMAFLREQGLEENTTVVFVSDHGEMGGAHGMGNKQFPYEDSAGIPLIVAGPGIPAGHRIATPTCSEDLYPTLLGLCGLSPRNRLEGENLAPLARGESDVPASQREGVLLEMVVESRPSVAFHARPYRALRTGRYMYSVLGEAKGTGRMEPWHLFDLEMDPEQMHNLVTDPASEELARRLHGLLRERLVARDDHAWLGAAWEHAELNATLVRAPRG